MRRLSLTIGAAGVRRAAVIVLSAIAAVTYGAANDVISARQANFKDLGAAFKKLGDELKKPSPAASQLDPSVARIADLAKQLSQQGRFFPKGSGPEAGVETGARKEIWEKPQEFQKALQTLSTEAGNLASIPTADTTSLKAQFRKLGTACKDCHTSFREKDD